MSCAVCGDPTTIARNKCHTCYEYARRHGQDRPLRLITRLTQRDIERETLKRRNR